MLASLLKRLKSRTFHDNRQASSPPLSNPPLFRTLHNHSIDVEMFAPDEVPPATGSGSRLGSAVVIVAGKLSRLRRALIFQVYSLLSRRVSLYSLFGCNSKTIVNQFYNVMSSEYCSCSTSRGKLC